MVHDAVAIETYGTSSRAVIERSPPLQLSQIEPVRPEIFAETTVTEHVPDNIPIGYRSRLGH